MFKIREAPQSLVFDTAPDESVPQACTPDRKIEYHVYVNIQQIWFSETYRGSDSAEPVFCSEELSFLSNETTKMSNHCWFLECWNREKSLTLIWQHFFMSTWWMDCKNIKKNFFSRWLFEEAEVAEVKRPRNSKWRKFYYEK